MADLPKDDPYDMMHFYFVMGVKRYVTSLFEKDATERDRDERLADIHFKLAVEHLVILELFRSKVNSRGVTTGRFKVS